MSVTTLCPTTDLTDWGSAEPMTSARKVEIACLMAAMLGIGWLLTDGRSDCPPVMIATPDEDGEPAGTVVDVEGRPAGLSVPLAALVGMAVGSAALVAVGGAVSAGAEAVGGGAVTGGVVEVGASAAVELPEVSVPAADAGKA